MSLPLPGFTPAAPVAGGTVPAPPANPLLDPTTGLPLAGVTLTQFGEASDAQRLEYLDLAATQLATTARGDAVRGVRLADATGPTHTIILSARGDADVDVTDLTRPLFDRLDGTTREMALALGTFPGAALGFPLTADELRRMTPAERLAHVTARAIALVPGVRVLTAPDAGGTATFLLAPTAGLIDLGRLRFDAYHRLPEADRDAARATGALDLRASAGDMRRAGPAIALRHINEFGAALGGTAVKGVTLPGPATFIASADGTRVIDLARLTFSDYHALQPADLARVTAAGGTEPVPTPTELRAATPERRLAYMQSGAVDVTALPGGGEVRSLPGAPAWADRIVLSQDKTKVIDASELTDAEFLALDPADQRAMAMGIPTPAELRAAVPARVLAYVTANAIVIDTLPDGTLLRGLPPRSAAWPDPFVLSADRLRVIDAAMLTDEAFRALSPKDRAIAAATGGPRTLPTASGFLALSDADRLAVLQRNGVVLATLPGGGEVRGLRLGDPSGARTFAIAPDANDVPFALDATALDLGAFYGLNTGARAVALALGAPAPLTTGAFATLNPNDKADAVARFGRTEDAGGTPVSVLRLNGPGGPQAFVALPSARVANVATDVQAFYDLTATDRAIVAALGGPTPPTATQYDNLQRLDDRIDAIKRFGRDETVGGTVRRLLRLPDAQGQRTFAVVDEAGGPKAREVGARNAAEFYAMGAPARAFAGALGVPRTLTAAQYDTLSGTDQIDAIDRFGRALRIGGDTVPVLSLSANGATRSFAVVTDANGTQTAVEVSAPNLAAFYGLSPAARDVAQALGRPDAFGKAEFLDLKAPADWHDAIARFGREVTAAGTTQRYLPLEGAINADGGGTKPTELAAADLDAFYDLPPAARDVAQALGLPGPFDAAALLGLTKLTDRWDAVNRFGRKVDAVTPVPVLRLDGAGGTRTFAALPGTRATGPFEVVERSLTQLYAIIPGTSAKTATATTPAMPATSDRPAMSGAQRAVTAALGLVRPLESPAFDGLSDADKIDAVGLLGTPAATDGGTVPVLRLAAPADAGTRTMAGITRAVVDVARVPDGSKFKLLRGDAIDLTAYHGLSDTERGVARALGAPGPIDAGQFDGLTDAQKEKHIEEFGTPTLTGGGRVPVLDLTRPGERRVYALVGSTVLEIHDLDAAKLAALKETARNAARSLGAPDMAAAVAPPYLERDADQRIADATAIHFPELVAPGVPKLADNTLMATTKANASTDAFRDAFLQAHSLHQLEWLHANAGRKGVALGKTPALNQVNVMLSDDGRRVINVDALTVGDVSRLPLADQELLAAENAGAYTVPGFAALLTRLGMTTDRAEMRDSLNSVRDILNGTTIEAGEKKLRTVLPAADQQLFLDQIATIEARLATTAIFSAQALSTALAAIDKRHKRMAEFHKALDNPDAAGAGLDVVTMRDGYNDFLREERRIRNVDQRIAQMTRLAALGVPTLDLPALIVELQSLYEVKAKAAADADTAELEQQNALLRDYAALQGIVNETSALMDPKDTEERRSIVDSLTERDRLRKMFGRTTGTVPHPIEVLTGASRPKVEMRTFVWQGPKNDGRTNDAINGYLVQKFDEWGANTMPPAFERGGRYDVVREWTNMPGNDKDNPIWLDEKEKRVEVYFDKGDRKERLVDDFTRRAAARDALGLKQQPDRGFFSKLDDNFRAAFNDAENKGDQLQDDEGIKQIWLSYLFEKGLDGPDASDFEPQGFRETYGVSMKEIWAQSDEKVVKRYEPELRKDQWDGYGTRLAEVVTTINQSNQLRQNAISQAERQANRHFDVVSNTLKRMFDLNQAIGRNAA